jgi:hypothetical protein
MAWQGQFQGRAHVEGEKKQYFMKVQEGARKDVKRAFGVLQACWEIVKNSVR